MQHQCNNGGGVQARRPTEEPGSRDGGKLTRSSTHGRGCASQKTTAVLGPEQNDSEWRRWDQDHGHVLWMGNLQDDWNNATIAGFFRYYGAEITVARKGRDNYCFVEFASTEDAKNFMAKYNHQPLPGKLGNSNRFNIRPRTRPRWYRGAEHQSSSIGGGGRDDGGHGRGSRAHDSRGARLDTRNNERVGTKRQQLREIKTERRSPQPHQQTHQGRGVGTNMPADRGYYGPKKGNSDRDGHEGWAPRMPPVSRQRGVPEHDLKGRVDHGKHRMVPRGGRLRSRSWSRSRPQLRQQSRSGSPPHAHASDKRCRSTSSGKDQSSSRIRRRCYDPSLAQARVPNSVVGGGSGDRASDWAPSTFTAGSSSRGEGRRLPRATEKAVTLTARGGRDCNSKQNLTAANSFGDSITRVDEGFCRWSDIESEKVGGERILGGSAEEAGRRGAEPTTAVNSGEQVAPQTQQVEPDARSSGLDQGDTFEAHPGWEDGPLNDDETSGSRRQPLDDGIEKYAKTAITTHALEAAAPVHGGTTRLESALSGSSSWPAGDTVTSNKRNQLRGTRKEDSTTSNVVTHEESLPTHEARPGGALPPPLPSSTVHPPRFQPLQRDSHDRAGTGTRGALPTGSGGPSSDVGGGPNQPEEDSKEGSTTESVCDASLSSNDSGLDGSCRLNDSSEDGEVHAEDTLSGSRATRPSPGLQPRAGGKADERGSDRDVEQNKPPPPRRGTKRHGTTDITLAQVIHHHMERRRLNGVESGRERVRVEGKLSGARASSSDHMASADNDESKNDHDLNGKRPSAGAASCDATTRGPSSECSAIVAAAWANGCVLPLTEVVAPHMRMVAPVLAAEPEGRRIVVHSAAAVAAGAAILALPHHRLEVSGTCRDGLLLELRPKEEGVRCKNSLDQREESAFLSACAGRLQATFDGLVKLDLEFDTVRLPHGEAMDIMGTDSSSAELMRWLNKGTTTLVRLSAPRASPPVGASSTEQAPWGGDLAGLKEALARQSGTPFLGIDCNLWPLLPRTGLLASFGVSIHPVVLPPSEPMRVGSRVRRSVIHLAVTLSDSVTSLGTRSDSVGGLQSIKVPPGLEVSGARGTTGSLVTSDAAAVDLPQPGASPLRCVPPTCTAGGLTWRHVTGLRCVAAVNKLALGSRRELEGQIQLAEGLHTAEIEGLAKRVTAFPGVLLVTLAGRQGASAGVIASRLCVELRIKGRNPAMLDTGNYLRNEAPRDQVAEQVDPEDPVSNSSPPASHQHLDSVALGGAISTLIGQARSGAGLSGVNNGGNGAAAGEHDVAGLTWAAGGRQRCDIVVVHGRDALDTELLRPGKLGLGPAEAVSVFVDLVPQVCVDNLTPINGADVRLLRSLLAAHTCYTKASEAVTFGYDGGNGGSGSGYGRSSCFDTHGFLEEWLVAEEREQRLCRSFRPAMSVHLNTALPYDLHVLKPAAEPLLRSVAPPTKGSRGGSGGGDGCRSSIYALSRSTLRLLRLCEALRAPSVPATSVLSGLIRSVP